MKFSNDNFLPSAIYDAVTTQLPRDARRGHSDISVTEIVGPPRIKQLLDRYGDRITVDVSDEIQALQGTAMHEYIAKRSKGRSELQLYSQWSGFQRMWVASGIVDLIDEDDVLWDYKNVKVKALDDGVKEEWEAQLNLYNRLCADNGIGIAEMKVLAIFKDWGMEGKYLKSGYPPYAAMTYPVRMWSKNSTEAYIQYRLGEHEKAFPMCTSHERWADDNKFALMREGRKTAVKLYDTEAEARIQMDLRRQAMPNKVWYTQERIAMSRRCKFYCKVWEFCDYGQQERGTNAGGPP